MGSIETNDFVILKYRDQYFPGQVTEIGTETLKVSAMERSLQNWKWPEKPDVIVYEKGDIVKKINPPRRINARGAYSVPEMKRYDLFF